jgi:hypothetical protein
VNLCGSEVQALQMNSRGMRQLMVLSLPAKLQTDPFNNSASGDAGGNLGQGDPTRKVKAITGVRHAFSASANQLALCTRASAPSPPAPGRALPRPHLRCGLRAGSL